MKKPFQHLYVHVPFCATKCSYCAFYSAIGSGEFVVPYLDKIKNDFEKYSSQAGVLKSVYLGGGTPTLLEADQLETLFLSIYANFKLSKNAEISIECNPETLTDAKAKVIGKYANRVSMGVQTFNNEHRKIIGRDGDVNAVYAARKMLAKYNIENVSCDLIYAIPTQTIEDLNSDIAKILDLDVKHISAYSLTVEEGTRLMASVMNEASDDISFDMWENLEKQLAQKGFSRYEVSNYAQKGFECVHNSSIWNGDSYLGCGPSAVSFDGIDRWEQSANIKNWIEGADPKIDSIEPEHRAREVFIMGLRTAKGWNINHFKSQTGYDCREWLADAEYFIEEDLLIVSDSVIKCSTEGLAFWNSIAEVFI